MAGACIFFVDFCVLLQKRGFLLGLNVKMRVESAMERMVDVQLRFERVKNKKEEQRQVKRQNGKGGEGKGGGR